MPVMHFSPDEIDMMTLAVIGLITTVIGMFAALFKRVTDMKSSVDNTSGTIEVVRNQVQNDHSTNMREDLDRMHEAIERLAQSIDAEKHYRSKTDGALDVRLTRLEDKLDWLKEGK